MQFAGPVSDKVDGKDMPRRAVRWCNANAPQDDIVSTKSKPTGLSDRETKPAGWRCNAHMTALSFGLFVGGGYAVLLDRCRTCDLILTAGQEGIGIGLRCDRRQARRDR